MRALIAVRRNAVSATAFTVLLVVGAKLRATPLGPSSLWLDDAWAALASKAEGMRELWLTGVTAPGFAVLLKLWIALLGPQPIAAQSLAFVAGTLSAPLAYVVARRFGTPRGVAFLAGGILAFSPVHIVYATRVKQYTLESLLCLLLLWLGIQLIQSPSSKRPWRNVTLACIAATAFSASLAIVAGGVFLAGAVAVLRSSERRFGPFVFSACAYGLFAAAWWAIVLQPRVNDALHRFWAAYYIDISNGLSAAVAETGGALTRVTAGLVALPSLPVVVALLISAIVVLVRRLEVGILLVSPLVFALALAALQRAPIGGGRTDIYLLPTMALLPAFAIASAAAHRELVANAVAALLALGLLTIDAPSPRYPNEDTRPLVAHFEKYRAPGDVLVVYHLTAYPFGLYTTTPIRLRASEAISTAFIVEPLDASIRVFDPKRTPMDRILTGPEGSRPRHVWLLSSHDTISGHFEELEARLIAEKYELLSSHSRPDAVLQQWRVVEQ